MTTHYLYEDEKKNQHFYALSGRKFDTGTVNFWLEDNGKFVQDLTYPIDIHRPSYMKGKEVAILAEDFCSQEFLLRHGFIHGKPIGQFQQDGSLLLVAELTRSGQYQASLLLRGFERDITHFYAVTHPSKTFFSQQDIYYLPSTNEVNALKTTLNKGSELLPLLTLYEQNQPIQNFELDHGITILDVYKASQQSKKLTHELESWMSM